MKYTILFILVLSSFLGAAQSVSGLVTDKNNEACPYVEILIISDDSSVVLLVVVLKAIGQHQ